MADWSQLPKELLQLISEHLDSALYLLRFRSVCSTWRSSIPIHHHFHHHLPFKFPQFRRINNNDSDDDDNDNDNASTFSLSKRTTFLVTQPPHNHHHQQQTLRPWLIEIVQDSRGRTRTWHSLLFDTPLPFPIPHVLDFNQRRVFDLGHVFVPTDSPPIHTNYLQKAVAATWQGDKEDFGFSLLAIFVCGELALFRGGDDQWTEIPGMWAPYSDVFIFKGRPCAVDTNGRTVTIGPDSSVDLLAEPVFGGGTEKLLVESEGELLLVDKYLDYHENEQGYENVYGLDEVVSFDVYRLEEKEKKWVQLTTLGDRILFLGSKVAFSASASDLCVGKGNCVVFRDHNGSGMHVFDLDEGWISPLSDDDPGYSKLFWPYCGYMSFMH